MTKTGKQKTPAIIFDLGGVLIDWNPRYLFRKLFDGDEERVEWFLTEVCPQSWNVQMDGGYPFEQAIAERIEKFPELSEELHAYWERWEETIGGAIPGTVEILAELREAGYPLYVLSNWSAETFARVRAHFPFLDWFDGLVISGQIGLLKPNREIFEHLLEQVGRPAEECLFIDDHATNTEAAEQLGFQTVLFTTPGTFKEQLIAKNII
ncbi:MAG: 2-haloacid dehalogenase [Chloroflexota bacterium]|nr:2-haloacid dehalogenase [Chloroflexota bacterium]